LEPVTVMIPESMQDSLQGRLAEGGYASLSEYVSELIRADLIRKAEERVDVLLLEGLDSGEPILADDKFWEAQRDRLTSRFGRTDEGR
jgi:antitoxin ParD1/3/4